MTCLLTRRRWSTPAFAAVLSPFVLGLGGCGSLGTDGSLSAAQVRFVQVSPGSPEMDFYVNGTGAAYGVGYENFTSYLPVNPGAVSLSASRAGLGQALVSEQLALGGGHQYTVLVSHGLGSLQERIYADQDTPAPAGQMALRVLNEVEGARALTVYVSPLQGSASPVAVLSVAAGAASAYVAAPAGSYRVSVASDAHEVNLPLQTVTVKANSGAVRTVVFSGTLQAEGHSNVVGFALADADPS